MVGGVNSHLESNLIPTRDTQRAQTNLVHTRTALCWLTVETVSDFIFLGSKITADGDCSHAVKRHLLLRRKSMTILDTILKSRDLTLSTKVYLVKAMVFSVVMYGCEIWTQKAEC